MKHGALKFYVLDGHRVVPASREVWAPFFGSGSNRRVAETITAKHRVSTMFIGVGHVLFETMAFSIDANNSISCVRSSTWDEAVAAHNATVAALQRLDLAKP